MYPEAPRQAMHFPDRDRQCIGPCFVLVLLGTLPLVAGADVPAAKSLPIPPRLPLGFAAVPVPEDNPPTVSKIRLGKRLFSDRRISKDGKVSCASCHRPDTSFADRVALSPGVEGRRAAFNTPTLLNVAYAPHLMGDGRSHSLEDQVRYPLTHPNEMNMTRQAVIDTVTGDAEYRRLFGEAFPESKVTFDLVAKAIASFERTLLSGNSAFDRYFFGNEPNAISPAARRGWDLFSGRAGCQSCHRFDKDHLFFTDFAFHNLGVGFDSEVPNLGRYLITRERADKGRVKTPGLRDVARTAPYMHDGRFRTLREVIDFHVQGGFPNPFLDEALRPVQLTRREVADLVQFLESLDGKPSGLESTDVREPSRP